MKLLFSLIVVFSLVMASQAQVCDRPFWLRFTWEGTVVSLAEGPATLENDVQDPLKKFCLNAEGVLSTADGSLVLNADPDTNILSLSPELIRVPKFTVVSVPHNVPNKFLQATIGEETTVYNMAYIQGEILLVETLSPESDGFWQLYDENGQVFADPTTGGDGGSTGGNGGSTGGDGGSTGTGHEGLEAHCTNFVSLASYAVGQYLSATGGKDAELKPFNWGKNPKFCLSGSGVLTGRCSVSGNVIFNTKVPNGLLPLPLGFAAEADDLLFTPVKVLHERSNFLLLSNLKDLGYPEDYYLGVDGEGKVVLQTLAQAPWESTLWWQAYGMDDSLLEDPVWN